MRIATFYRRPLPVKELAPARRAEYAGASMREVDEEIREIKKEIIE